MVGVSPRGLLTYADALVVLFPSAIHGYSFCRAGHKAYSLLSENIICVAAINSVGVFVLFLGKVVVIVSTVLIGIEIMEVCETQLHMYMKYNVTNSCACGVIPC